ncbi:type I phosphodiesterase / nucleotide pyrophosphatase family protein [Bordetella holmesii 41130]|nr:type I phosphodiesterase / nucleotide pyrophosphatase family protein [Bordetella holmesii 41130]
MKGRNIVVIMSDEHNPAFMGCSGHPFIKTPHLDALAARGVRFPNAYTPSPICVPARAAFATGQRVHQTRHWDNAMPYIGDPSGWGHALQEHGVRVESIGKLHYRNEEDPVGFDAEHIPMHVLGGHGMVWASIRDPYLPSQGRKRMLGERIGIGESPYTAYDRSVTERTLDWLRNAAAKDRPFALYVGLVAPHFPLIAPQAFYALYDARQIPQAKLHPKQGYERHPWVQAYAEFERSEETFADENERVSAFLAYYALCSFLDSNVGRILSELETLGLKDSTHVVYTSDHGDNVGARGLWGKSTLYQESVGIPMLLAGPDVSPGCARRPWTCSICIPPYCRPWAWMPGPIWISAQANPCLRSPTAIRSAARHSERVPRRRQQHRRLHAPERPVEVSPLCPFRAGALQPRAGPRRAP